MPPAYNTQSQRCIYLFYAHLACFWHGIFTLASNFSSAAVLPISISTRLSNRTHLQLRSLASPANLTQDRFLRMFFSIHIIDAATLCPVIACFVSSWFLSIFNCQNVISSPFDDRVRRIEESRVLAVSDICQWHKCPSYY